MNVLIAPDSYKGSLSAIDVSLIIKKAFTNVFVDVNCVTAPMADGGEGILDTLLFSTSGHEVHLEANGPLGDKIPTVYGVSGDGETAIIEMAKVAGLPMIPKDQQNPLLTTTYGIGEVILHAIDQGYRKFIIGLGGSATNDGGLGMLQALGARFINRDGKSVQPIGASLADIHEVDFSGISPILQECEIKIASDVENPLCGKEGASHVFGPQKGATPEQIEELDQGLAHFASKVEEHLGKSYQRTPGAGAAGGLGFGLLVIGAQLYSGAKLVADQIQLENNIEKADLIITGEGQSDFQTRYGKVPSYVGKRSKEHGKPCLLIAGSLGEGIEQLDDLFVSYHSIMNKPMSLEEAMENVEDLLYQTAVNIAKLVKAFKTN
ncbi:glycerate kinase [Pontibacillus sp. HMF3514]|uniref:glycerate kinase n=1 Tax=Pontibacillus sp. HMF3514 TaxID=2692425 RepID=UPI00131F5EBE|nr:glycerate kinase [Pontibacillus sp. HMF3514]QHE51639.1 glycerate kinase [Pontibacillus sp. HMF3514]